MRGCVARVFNNARISNCLGHVELRTIMEACRMPVERGFVVTRVEAWSAALSRCFTAPFGNSKIRVVGPASNESLSPPSPYGTERSIAMVEPCNGSEGPGAWRVSVLTRTRAGVRV